MLAMALLLTQRNRGTYHRNLAAAQPQRGRVQRYAINLLGMLGCEHQAQHGASRRPPMMTRSHGGELEQGLLGAGDTNPCQVEA